MKRFFGPALAVLLLGALVTPASASASTDWSAYLFSARHVSKSASAAITTSNVGSLAKSWTFTSPKPTMTGQPSGGFIASPIVAGGRVFIGSNTGVFYALNESTGKIIWSKFVGFVTKTTCNARGIAATATVANDPVTLTPAVYVAGGDGYLYAFDAATGNQLWRSLIAAPSATVNDYYNWSSPTVAGGRIIIGISSQCDTPLIQGGVSSFDQHAGTPLHTWFTVPSGSIGGSVWSSVAANATSAWVTTGNSDPGTPGDWDSIVRLDAATLTVKARWQVPSADSSFPDSDFGASPTLFSAGGVAMVGACNKNGKYYAWNAGTLKLVWKLNVAVGSVEGLRSCLSASAWNGSALFPAGAPTTINGINYPGSIRKVDPLTGAPAWQTGLGGAVVGNPSMNGAGVLAVPLYDQQGGTNGVQLLDAATGAKLRLLTSNQVYAQPAFAAKYLFVATQGGALAAWKVP